MDSKTLFAVVYAAVMVAAFLVGKYVFPNVPQDVKDKAGILGDWAAKFVVWAKEFLDKETGEEKMAAVVEQLKRIADEAGLDVTEDQLKAIAQAAYEAMKAGEAQGGSPMYYKIGSRECAKPGNGGVINIFTNEKDEAAIVKETPDGGNG